MSLENNKIFAAILVALLLGAGAGQIAKHAIHPEHPAEEAFPIEVAEVSDEAGGATEEKTLEKVSAFLAKADSANGMKIAKKCAACHTFDKGGANKIGPNLWNIVNGPKAHLADFSYSSAMKDKGGKWDYESLNAFFYKPKEYLPGTKMVFAGLKKVEDRADLIAYLRSLSDNPAPLP